MASAPLGTAQRNLATQLGSVVGHRAAFELLLQGGAESVPVFIYALSFKPSDDASWSSFGARRLAAEGLGRLKAVEAVDSLLELLDEQDTILRGRAVWALGEIGDPRAIPPLIPLLGSLDAMGQSLAYIGTSYTFARSSFEVNGEELPAYKVRLGDVAAHALEKLGQETVVRGFSKALDGDTSEMRTTDGVTRDRLIAALMRAVQTAHSDVVVNAVLALKELGAVEALPILRAKAASFSFVMNRVRQQCTEAVEALEEISVLPSSVAMESKSDTLPRTAEDVQTDPTNLPRSMDPSEPRP